MGPRMSEVAQALVLTEGDRLEGVLRQSFGVTTKDIAAVAAAMYQGFREATSLHPKGFGGTNAWAQGTSAMRVLMIPKGWRAEDPLGQPRVVSRDKKISITLSSGNAFTGVADQIPQTRNDKGSQTVSSVNFNARQGQLFPADAIDHKSNVATPPGQVLWIFLYFIDLDNEEIRYELSQPTSMSDADKVSGWSTRLVFSPMQLEPIMEEYSDDDASDIDIEVTPKLL